MSTLPLLALPGVLCDERVWHAQAEALAARHPLTSFALTGHDSIAGLADAALARAPAGRFALAGFSMGGYVAFEIMRKAPERVAALALIDTHARPDTPEASAARRSAMAQAGSDFAGVIAALMPRIVHPSRLGDARLIATIEAMAYAVGPAGFVRQLQAIIDRVDSRPTLARIRCPTVVICGRDDALMPLELHQESADGIPGARLVVLDACGHMAPMERPVEVSDALREWLEGAGA